MTPSKPHNTARIEYIAASFLLLWFAFTTLPHAWRALNSDFSNYYITAHLVRDHSSTQRIYEWIWFQRQKDHLQINQSFSAMPPLTPFSTMFLLPFTWLAPLAAKHAWLLFNAALLFVTAWMLLRITKLPRSRLLLIIAASYPLQRNLLNGQYYILLLFFIVLGLWLHLRGNRFSAGISIAIAIGLKLFPALFVLYFIRKKDWRAFAGTVAGGAAVATASLVAFGWQLHRLYILQVLPRGMRGESTGPYNLTSASFTVLFHRLFIYEPTLNPHPAIYAPWLFSLLLPLVQLAIIAPLLLFTKPSDQSPSRVQLEWAAVLLACLTLSPLPASYHFVLLFLPIAVLLKNVTDEHSRWKTCAVILLFLAICFPYWPGLSGGGWLPLLHVPRLYAMIALYALTLLQLRSAASPEPAINKVAWLAALTTLATISIIFGLRTQRNVDPTYAYRLTLPDEPVLLSQPQPTAAGIAFIAMERNGYRASQSASPGLDELSQATSRANRWVERVSATSTLLSANSSIPDAESPILSPDGEWLLFSRQDHGRVTLWLHSLHNYPPDTPLTPPALDVLEASFAPGNEIVFSAIAPGHAPALFARHADAQIVPIDAGEARYPAVSPDGKWLAFSRLTHGSWNLMLRDRATGRTASLTDTPCNHIESAWEPDSRTLLYASDCGRAIGQSALYRREVVH